MWIQQTLESALLLEQYPRSEIKVFVQVLQADGSNVAAAVNAATLALADAGVPMRDLVVACTAGMLGRRAAIDLSREEEMAGGAQILVAAHAGSKKISLLEVESKVPEGQLQRLQASALAGCEAIAAEMKTCLLEHASQEFSLRVSMRSGMKT